MKTSKASTSNTKSSKKGDFAQQAVLVYKPEVRPSYLRDLMRAPREVQKKAEKAQQELEVTPVTPRGTVIKKLKGFESLWRYRLGDYRLIYAVDKDKVQLLCLDHRSEIYQRFNYNPDAPDDFACLITEASLLPDSKAAHTVKSKNWWDAYAQQQHAASIAETAKSQSPKRIAPQLLPIKLAPDLLISWHIPEEYHAVLVNCKTDDDLENSGIDQKVLLSVIDLVYAKTVAQIADEPVLTVENLEQIDEYLETGLSQFLLKLDPEQEKLMDWGLEGPTLIKGGPGSGKSTITLYRIRAIVQKAKAAGQPAPSFVFLTYTNALVDATRQLLTTLLGRLGERQTVSTVDKLAKDFYTEAKRVNAISVAHEPEWEAAIKQLREYTKNPTANRLSPAASDYIQTADAAYLAGEFENVIDGRDITTLDQYLKADRSGLGRALRQRELVWEIYKAAHSQITQRGHLTAGEVYRVAVRFLQENPARKFEFVFLDEVQDLSPAAIRFCVELARAPANLLLAADSSQSIYRRGFTYSKVHEQLNLTGKTRILRRNYRTTHEITMAAAQVLLKTEAGDAETLAQTAMRHGIRPRICRNPLADRQIAKIAEFIRQQCRAQHLPLGAAAVLCVTNDQCASVAAQLSRLGLPALHMAGKSNRPLTLDAPEVKVITIHSSKGLEFPVVAVPFVDAGILPRTLKPDSSEDPAVHLAQQRRLLFVALTRAMNALLVTSSGPGRESEFVAALSTDHWDFE